MRAIDLDGERPITVTVGTNTLVGHDMERLVRLSGDVLDGRTRAGQQPLLWDGRAGERIADVIEAWAAEGAVAAEVAG